MHEQARGLRPRSGETDDSDELLGFPFPMRPSIEGMESLLDMKFSVERILLLVSDERSDYQEFCDRIERQDVPISYMHVPGPAAWDQLDRLRSIILAPRSVDAIAQFLRPSR